MRWVHKLSNRLLFLVALGLGLQLPAVVDQYGQRLQARQLEAQQQVDQFRAIAERFFGGDYQALIDHHRRSSDPVFRAEAELLQQQYQRSVQLGEALQALQVSLPQQLLHIAFAADAEILEHTLHAHRPTLPLEPAALLVGLVVALTCMVVWWLPIALLAMLRRWRWSVGKVG